MRTTTIRRATSAIAILLGAVVLVGTWRGRGEPRSTVPFSYDGHGAPLGPLPAPATRPNLILVVVDTLRADALHAAAPGGAIDPATSMPFLSRLAARGTWFADAVAQAPWTMPSVASLLTGLLPHRHGAVDVRRWPELPPARVTFAEVLVRSYGYETVAFVDGTWLGGKDALLQGFDSVSLGFRLREIDAPLAAWDARRDRSRPFFLLLHTLEAHDPYGATNHAPRGPGWVVTDSARRRAAEMASTRDLVRGFFLDGETRAAAIEARGRAYWNELLPALGDVEAWDGGREVAAEVRAAYFEGASWVDGLLRGALATLDRHGLLDGTVLVITSDHGEAFGEHGMLAHGRRLDDELIRVPLVVDGPPPFRGGGATRGTVALIDVLPTFFDHAGLVLPPGLDGRSALGLLGGDDAPRSVVAQEFVNEGSTGRPGESFRGAVRGEGWKWLVEGDPATGEVRERWFDLRADPGERSPLADPEGATLPDAFRRAVAAERDRVRRATEGPRRRPATVGEPATSHERER